MDVDTAFLNSKMTEPVYVCQPPGFIDPVHPDYAWKLYRSMYGLKQASLLWNTHIHKIFSSLIFNRHDGEYGIYLKNYDNRKALVALYMNSLFIASLTEEIMKDIKDGLCRNYSI